MINRDKIVKLLEACPTDDKVNVGDVTQMRNILWIREVLRTCLLEALKYADNEQKRKEKADRLRAEIREDLCGG